MFIPLITIILSAAHIFGASAEQQPPNEQDAPTKEWKVLLAEGPLPNGSQSADILLCEGCYVRVHGPRGPQEFQSAVEGALGDSNVMAHLVLRALGNNARHDAYVAALHARRLAQPDRVLPAVEQLLKRVVTVAAEKGACKIILWNPFTNKVIEPPKGLERIVNDSALKLVYIKPDTEITFDKVRGRIRFVPAERLQVSEWRCVIQ